MVKQMLIGSMGNPSLSVFNVEKNLKIIITKELIGNSVQLNVDMRTNEEGQLQGVDIVGLNLRLGLMI